MGKRALITGITGQDGYYLSEFLHKKDYELFGLVRRTSIPHTGSLRPSITLIPGDLLDQTSLARALDIAQPDEVYNLAAMSHVGNSFSYPVATGEYNGLGAVKMLDATWRHNEKTRFYQASTSELFGNTAISDTFGLNERTAFRPCSPYATAKLYAHQSVINYRKSYGMFACAGILFNHESPRRGLDFVTRKITDGVARIKHGLQDKLTLGSLSSKRDWGFAGDYVEAMWLMLQQEQPGDYVIATGEAHSVEEFAYCAFEYAGIPQPWHGRINVDTRFIRPADIDCLVGDASKAKRVLGWQPHMSFNELVATMVENDLRRVEHEIKFIAHPGHCIGHSGHRVLLQEI